MYHFKVVVGDMVGHSCASDVFIKVVDVNDNRPVFEQEEYFATVRENATSSVVLTQVMYSCLSGGVSLVLTRGIFVCQINLP